MSALRALRSASIPNARGFSTSAPRSFGIAKMNILGNLTNDVELTSTNSGLTVAKYSVAVDVRAKSGNDNTSFFRVSAFEPTDYVKNLKKGTQVFVEADAAMKKYETKEGHPAVALDLVQRRLTVLRRPRNEEPTEE
ncbi:putative ssDNA binding protein [Ascodesmis nigricans]|uniref:Putative ssDNA binding protein n=1 Tax=Ascodesmis nigricans TaxID=341454 RepID=A0A4S2MRQ7_9PEZI|nr:putative ssDNA binding protein [Ascodesmis nigricans]